jgi:excisionase family DNA binding protein
VNTIFLTTVEVASILRISKALCYRLIAKGELPAIKFGRTLRVKQDDLDVFIRKNSTTQNDPNLGDQVIADK